MIEPRSAVRALLVAVLAMATGRVVHAQELRGVVRDSTSGLPIPGAVVTLLDSASTSVARTITNERGQFRVVLLSNAVRSLRLVRLGFRPARASLPRAENGVMEMQIVMVSIPLALQPVTVAASPNCPRRKDRALALALFEQARAGLLATVVARSQKFGRMKLLRAERFLAGTTRQIVHQSVRIDYDGYSRGSFGAAASAADFVRNGFAVDSQGVMVYYGPDADILLDDRFAAGYCFHVEDRDPSRPNQVGLGFQPVGRKSGRIDVDGALWIDTVAKALVQIDYRYVGVDPRMEPFRPGGQTFFRTMPNGSVLIDRWSIRMVGPNDDAPLAGRAASPWTDQRNIEPTLRSGEVWGELARAEWTDTTWRSNLGALRLRLSHPNRAPATGVIVRLDDTDYTGVADSTGVVVIEDLVPGPYTVSIVDSVLAPLGIDLGTPMKFTSTRDTTVTRDMIVETAKDYVGDRCWASATSKAKSAEPLRGDVWLIARVTGPDGERLDGAKWSLSKRGLGGAEQRLLQDIEIGSDGLVQYCQLYRGETVVISIRAKGMIDKSVTVTLTKQPTAVSVEMSPRR